MSTGRGILAGKVAADLAVALQVASCWLQTVVGSGQPAGPRLPVSASPAVIAAAGGRYYQANIEQVGETWQAEGTAGGRANLSGSYWENDK